MTSPPIARTTHFTATVTDVTALSPKMRRIRLAADGFAEQNWPLACDVAVVLTAEDREVRRRYTVRTADGNGLVLDAVLHGHGPGSTWAERVAAGDTVVLYGPRGEVPLPAEAGWVLALTDEAGLPAVAAVAERTDLPIILCAETSSTDETYPLSANVQPSWMVRGSVPAGGIDVLTRAIDDLGPQDWDTGFAYVLGESRAAVALRDVLVARGLHRVRIYAKGYWNLNARNTR